MSIEDDGGFAINDAMRILNELYTGVEVEGENFLKAITMKTYNERVKLKNAAVKAAKAAAKGNTKKEKVVKCSVPAVTKVKAAVVKKVTAKK
jgi:hypothetical protein